MSGFNVCVSVSQDGLNQGSQTVYTKLHGTGKVFSGSSRIERDGLTIDVTYDCTKAPVFDLSPPPAGDLEDAMTSMAGLALCGTDGDATRELISYAADVASSFSVTFPDLSFTFGSKDEPPIELVTDITVLCVVTVDGGNVAFAAIAATAPKQPTVGAQFVVDTFILPTIKTSANSLFAGLTIPPLDIPGVPLTAPVVVIANSRLYAGALLAGQGVPVLPSTGVPGPANPFFMLLDQAAMQAAASYAVGQSGTFHKSGKSGGSGFNAHYEFTYRLHNPKVGLDGTSLEIGFQLTGSVGAGVEVFWVPIGLGYQALAQPDPAATCALVPDGRRLKIIARSLDAFTLLVVPTGSIPTKVLSWMTEFIVQGVIGALAPLIKTFLKDIDFSTLQVPAFTETIAGETITITPGDLAVQSVDGRIALVGQLNYS